MKRILSMRFLNARLKALTLSYDDGVRSDARFMEILDKHGLKCTFNLNSGLYPAEDSPHRRLSRNASIELYKNSPHEVAVHGLTHPFLERLAAANIACERGKPVFLFMHTPLYTEGLYKSSLKYGPVIHAMSVPEEILATYPADRYEQQKQDDVTARAFEFIKDCENIKGIFVGHKHYDYEDVIGNSIPQMMIGCNTLREITVI